MNNALAFHRKSPDRSYQDHGWLKARHTFSFGDYYDPEFMGYSVLRVINEDSIEGGQGFPMHGHKNMEIITYVIEGALSHKDTLGNASTIRPGDVQRMSAGTGIRHSEFNQLPDHITHLLQIWIIPDQEGIPPGYEQKSFTKQFQTQPLTLVASYNGDDGSLHLHQDIRLYVGRFPKNAQVTHATKLRNLWIQIVKGELQGSANETHFKGQSGDGLAFKDVRHLSLSSDTGSEFLLFELPL